jgi:hypothetical protein
MSVATARILTRALVVKGFESITATTGVKTLSPASGTVQAVCQVQDEPIRFRLDGADPTSATGQEAFAGDVITIDGPDDIAAFEFIRHADSSPNGKLVCHYYG